MKNLFYQFLSGDLVKIIYRSQLPLFQNYTKSSIFLKENLIRN